MLVRKIVKVGPSLIAYQRNGRYGIITGLSIKSIAPPHSVATDAAVFPETRITAAFSLRSHFRITRLARLLPQVKKTAFAQGVRCASLGSRRTLCGNQKVASLKTDGKMRDACLDLQKNKKEKKKKKKDKGEGKGKGGRKALSNKRKKAEEGGRKGKGEEGRGQAKRTGGGDGREVCALC